MKRKCLIHFIMLLSACSYYQVRTPQQTLYDKVQSAIRTQNVTPLSNEEYDKISEYISEGKKNWIDLYPNFKNEPFVGMTSFQEGLNISMAWALPENLPEVLKFVNQYNVNEICGIPFIEPTKDEVYSYYLNARAALIAQGAASPWGAKCLSVMDTAMYDIKTFQSEGN